MRFLKGPRVAVPTHVYEALRMLTDQKTHMKDLATRSGKLLNDFEIGIQNKNSRQRSYFNIHNALALQSFYLQRAFNKGIKRRAQAPFTQSKCFWIRNQNYPETFESIACMQAIESRI